jgi:hypothetical protein
MRFPESFMAALAAIYAKHVVGESVGQLSDGRGHGAKLAV